jgi:hypothetical protein
MAVDDYILNEPNWGSPVKLAYTFDTNVIRTIKAFEQRAALFSWPRRKLVFDTQFSTPAERNQYTRLMARKQHLVFGVPIWPHQGYLTAQAGVGTAYVDLADVALMDFEQGGLCIIGDPNGTYETKTISSLAATRINFSGVLGSTWPIGTTIYPILHCFLEQSMPVKNVTSQVAGASFVFKEAWDSGITHVLATHTFPSYQGFTVFTEEPNWASVVNTNFSRSLEKLKDLGVSLQYTNEDESDMLIEGDHMGATLAEVANLRGLFQSHMGKWKQFWTPTWQRDVVLTAGLTIAGDTITIEDIEYTDYWANNQIIGKYLYLDLPGGAIYRKVIAWPSTTSLQLDTAVGEDVAVAIAENMLVSFLVPVRFEIDEMELSYHRVNVATTRLRMHTLQKEVMTTTTTTTTTSSVATTTS